MPNNELPKVIIVVETFVQNVFISEIMKNVIE